jgi:hypothetical protein
LRDAAPEALLSKATAACVEVAMLRQTTFPPLMDKINYLKDAFEIRHCVLPRQKLCCLKQPQHV